ncbi:hypothetical protein llap_576 [Limosa lapponica baueri]|uniref:Uncharacterized protein n=1 Tax=Limosa lapponica baueri TaxID=1758121 RepID=A0A2I0USV6_LIMLA|nr:hypothetical protein llap_576 [Limosa lapponica baueri]
MRPRPGNGMSNWKATVGKEKTEAVDYVGKGTFEQDWNRTALEETDILIPHKDSIEQKCQEPHSEVSFIGGPEAGNMSQH